jgi:hypothetical protein
MEDSQETPNEEEQGLLVVSKVGIGEDGEPLRYVMEWCEGVSRAEYTPDQARNRAVELFRAATIAECCSGAAANLFKVDPKPTKGFGKRTAKKNSEIASQVQEVVSLLMSGTRPFGDDISVRLKFKFENNSAVSHVRLLWKDGYEFDLDSYGAQSHAKMLFSIAESVQTDMYLSAYIAQQGADFSDQQLLLRQDADFRQQKWLESLIK